MTKEEFEAKKAEARKRVNELDAVDGIQDRLVGTIIAALECGLSSDPQDPGYGAEFDALVMLEDIRHSGVQFKMPRKPDSRN